MELAPVSDLSGTAAGAATAAGGVVHVEVVDVAALCDEGLSLRLGALGRAESALAAMKAQVLAEVGRRHSSTDAQRLVRDELQASKREAKRDVESATRLAELPATSEALASGEIPVGHARLIARASGESTIDEALLVKAANEEPFDEFARTVKRHQQDQAVDDGQSLLDRQRKNRKARIFESPESGMFVLSGEFDQITGARIATALTAKERQLWHREDPKTRRTPQQRMADALAELICEPAGDGKSAGTDLLVIADFDVIKQQLANPRLADGSPIPIVELHRLALEANLLPSIFDTKAQDMWLGRKQRTASEAQRVALIARDQHCVGCGANPLWCRAHHIIWWSKNGPTDVDNLVLVCDDCHHKIHDHDWQVYKHPTTGKYKLKPPNPTKLSTVTGTPAVRTASGDGSVTGATKLSTVTGTPAVRTASGDGSVTGATKLSTVTGTPAVRTASGDGSVTGATKLSTVTGTPAVRTASGDGSVTGATKLSTVTGTPAVRTASGDGSVTGATKLSTVTGTPAVRTASGDGSVTGATKLSTVTGTPAVRTASGDGSVTGATKLSTVTGTPAVRTASGDGSVTGATKLSTVTGTPAVRTAQPGSSDADRVTGTDLDRIERRRSSDRDRPGPDRATQIE